MHSQEWNRRGIQKTDSSVCCDSWSYCWDLDSHKRQCLFLKSVCLILRKTVWQYYCFLLLWIVYLKTLLNGSVAQYQNPDFKKMVK